jgi:hypothetical protein
VSRPVVHGAGEQVYRLLPDFIRASDDGTGYTALRYVAAAAVPLERAADFLALVDPDTSVTGTCELVNAAACPRPYLGWLGWLVGVNTAGIPAPYVRDAVGNAAASQRRGSAGSIRDAVQRTLTGSRSCRVYPNLTGTDPYLISVFTLTSETADTAATLAAAMSEKPAGCVIDLNVAAGSTWADVLATYDTWADVVAAHPTWAELVTWIPE